jgi:hypothetical protein
VTTDPAVVMEENRKPLNTDSDIGNGGGTTSGNGGTSGGTSLSFETVPGKFGSYAGYALMIAGMVGAIVCRRYASFPVLGSLKSWTSDCPDGYDTSCRANQAVLRFSFAMVIIFAVQLIGAAVYPRFYDTLWVPKVVIFICILIGFFYADPEVFDNHGYAWFGRIAGFGFVILQQIILLDFAFTVSCSVCSRCA